MKNNWSKKMRVELGVLGKKLTANYQGRTPITPKGKRQAISSPPVGEKCGEVSIGAVH